MFHLDEEIMTNLLPEDVWFYVECLQLAYVFLRLKEVLFIKLLNINILYYFRDIKSIHTHTFCYL